MKHSWIIAAGLSLLQMPAFADADTIGTFYGGLSAGGGFNSADFEHQVHTRTTGADGTVFSTNSLPSASNTQHYTGVGQFQIGAGMSFSVFYLGVEALGQVSNGDFDAITNDLVFIGNPEMQIPDSNFDFNTQLEMNNFEPAIDFKPGIFLSNNTLLYGRLGAAYNELTLSEQAHYELVNSLILVDVDTSATQHMFAMRVGLGLEHHLHDRFSVFMDYTYTSYQDISFDTSDVAKGQIGSETVLIFDLDSQVEMNNINKQVAMIGFNYHL